LPLEEEVEVVELTEANNCFAVQMGLKMFDISGDMAFLSSGSLEAPFRSLFLLLEVLFSLPFSSDVEESLRRLQKTSSSSVRVKVAAPYFYSC
jgi:hypothetical protein